MQNTRRTTTKCNGCGVKFGEKELAHVDDDHRFTPLCRACYYDDQIRKRTEYRLGDPPRKASRKRSF